MVRLIKRYGSRKLYDTEESRYVSLEELAVWIREGQEIRVVDKETEEDVTSQTLTQVIADEGRRDNSFPPSELLHEMIRRGEKLVSTGVKQLGDGFDRLLAAGAERVAPLREVREETQMLRQRLEGLEAALSQFERRATEKNVEPPGEAVGATATASEEKEK
ncbi:MAG: hypothetical protein GY716_03200 [bacterium]|nr:hypothetical protein [bacterium]